MTWRRWLTAGATVLVLGGCLWGIVSEQQRKAQREAEAWLDVFRPKTQDLVPDEARALADLAAQDYSARWSLLSWRWREGPWTTHSYVIDPTFLITQWRLADLSRYARDISLLVFLSAMRHSDFDLSVYALLEVDYKPDPEEALLKMRILNALDRWGGDSVYWDDRARLMRFQTIARRLPDRRAEIENDYVWPILLEQHERGELPNFVDHLSPETRQPRAAFIADALLEAASIESEYDDVAQQAFLLRDLIGHRVVRKITDILRASEPRRGYLGERTRQTGFLARLLNFDEPTKVEQPTQSIVRRVQDPYRKEVLGTFLTQLDDRHLHVACGVVWKAWMAGDAVPTSLAAGATPCVVVWENEELRGALNVAIGLHEELGPLRTYGIWRFSAAMAARLGDATSSNVWPVLRRAIETIDSDHPSRLRFMGHAIAIVGLVGGRMTLQRKLR